VSDVLPAVAGGDSNQLYLATWTVSPALYPGILGRLVPTSGGLVDPVKVVGGQWADYSAVASGSADEALITFQDPAGTGYNNIYGRLWGSRRVYLPLVVRNY
jgi:hypothetical protein